MRTEDFHDLRERVASGLTLPAFDELVRRARRRRASLRASWAGGIAAVVAAAALGVSAWPGADQDTGPAVPSPPPTTVTTPSRPPSPFPPDLFKLAYASPERAAAVWNTPAGWAVVTTSDGWRTTHLVRTGPPKAYPIPQPLADGSFVVTPGKCGDEPYLIQPDDAIARLRIDTSASTTLDGDHVLVGYVCDPTPRSVDVGVLDPGSGVIRPLAPTPGLPERDEALVDDAGRIWVLGLGRRPRPQALEPVMVAWSDDGGQSWRRATVPLDGKRLVGRALAVGDDGQVAALVTNHALTRVEAVFVTTDNGATWRTISAVPFQNAWSLAHSGGRLLALDPQGALWASDASWTSFERSTRLPPDETLDGAGSLIWAYNQAGDGDAMLTQDGAATWQPVNLAPPTG